MNALVPMTDKETLLRAHYYVLDIYSNDFPSDEPVYNSDGSFSVKSRAVKCNNNFRIEYCPEIFNPQPHTADIQYINKPGGPCLANKQIDYLKHLMNPDTKYKVYNRMFTEKNISDYPSILIMFDEKSIIDYGKVIAIYLSKVFGVNVSFLDEAMRPNVFGISDGEYKGDLEEGKKTIRTCKDSKLYKDIKLMITSESRETTTNNLMSQFKDYKTEELIYIYNKIFPDKPLYAGMYTRDDMLNILTGCICNEVDFNSSGMNEEELNESICEYEQQLSDWEMLTENERYELLQEAMDTGV